MILRRIRPPLAPPTQGENIPQIITEAEGFQPSTNPFQILDRDMTWDVIDLCISALSNLPEREVLGEVDRWINERLIDGLILT